MILRQGSSGEKTLDLQKKLNQLGYTVDPDSVYGSQTADAVRQFQRDAGIGEDGIAGNETMTAINAKIGGNTSAGTGGTSSNDPVTRAYALLEEHKANKPGEFLWDKQSQLDKTTEAWLNREDFSYDLSRDPFYQQYKKQYEALGKLAMEDTMGQAAALTGGYGNSWAQTVGQQVYNQHMQKLQEVVPELYGMARQTYNEEGQQLLNEISLLESQRQAAYGEHQDQINQWQNWLNYLNTDAQYQEQMAYKKERDAIADAQWERKFPAARSSGGGGGSSSGNEDIPDYIIDRLEQGFDSDEEKMAYLMRQAQAGAIDSTQMGQLAAGYSADGVGQDDSFAKYNYRSKTDGITSFDYNGKEVKIETGINPYTRTRNKDIDNGAFNNGYQPNNVDGKKLTATGDYTYVNGVRQNIWKTKDGTRYVWDGTENRYYKESEIEYTY